MAEHANASRIRELFAAFRAGDVAAIDGAIADDAVWRFPGRRGQLAGEHRGKERIFAFLMNVQELATAHIEKIAAKAVILNNQHLGMVVQWEDKFFEGNRGHTYLGDPRNRKQIYPDYIAMAKSFNVPCERVVFKKDLRAAIQRMLDSSETFATVQFHSSGSSPTLHRPA